MGDITTREEASTTLKRDWFYKDKDVARPVLTYNELCLIKRFIDEYQYPKGSHEVNYLYSKIVRAIHLIEERRIKGDKK